MPTDSRAAAQAALVQDPSRQMSSDAGHSAAAGVRSTTCSTSSGSPPWASLALTPRGASGLMCDWKARVDAALAVDQVCRLMQAGTLPAIKRSRAVCYSWQDRPCQDELAVCMCTCCDEVRCSERLHCRVQECRVGSGR